MVTWDDETMARVAREYRLAYLKLDTPWTDDGPAGEDDLDASELVDEGLRAGTLPLEVIDRMLEDPEGSEEFRWFVAAGPIEEMLSKRPARYAAAIDTRCRVNAVWRDVVAGVWLDRQAWERLPDLLRSFVPEPQRDPGPVPPLRPRRPRRPSRDGRPGRRRAP